MLPSAAADAVANQIGVRDGAHVILRPSLRVVLEMHESIFDVVGLVGVLPCHGGIILIDFAHLVFQCGQILLLHAPFEPGKVVHNFQQHFALLIISSVISVVSI